MSARCEFAAPIRVPGPDAFDLILYRPHLDDVSHLKRLYQALADTGRVLPQVFWQLPTSVSEETFVASFQDAERRRLIVIEDQESWACIGGMWLEEMPGNQGMLSMAMHPAFRGERSFRAARIGWVSRSIYSSMTRYGQ